MTGEPFGSWNVAVQDLKQAEKDFEVAKVHLESKKQGVLVEKQKVLQQLWNDGTHTEQMVVILRSTTQNSAWMWYGPLPQIYQFSRSVAVKAVHQGPGMGQNATYTLSMGDILIKVCKLKFDELLQKMKKEGILLANHTDEPKFGSFITIHMPAQL
jgi:hypothetical protein